MFHEKTFNKLRFIQIVIIYDIVFTSQEVELIVTINVTEKITTTKPSGTNKNLPKTSEQSSILITVLGTMVTMLSFVGMRLKRNEN